MSEATPVIHELCNGQGCKFCAYTGEILVRVQYGEGK